MAPKKGTIPWNKGLTGKEYLKHYPNGIVTNKFPKGNQYAKGKHPKYEFKKGQRPWNYVDGRSKIRSPDRYGDDWSNIRLLIYSRDNYTCQHCKRLMRNSKEAFHVHHKVPFLFSFDNSLNNLITLCKSCHSKEEMKLRKNHKEWYQTRAIARALRFATNNAKVSVEETSEVPKE